MTIKVTKTSRGFILGEFKDQYGAKCSIQESSLATESCIWLGRDQDFKGQEIEFGRMHLTQKMVADLLPLLTLFAKTGSLDVNERRRK